MGLIVALVSATSLIGALSEHGARHGVLAELPAGSRLVDRHGRPMADIEPRGHDLLGYWRLDTVPERVALATVALEDRRFSSHPGVDPFSILRAAGQNLAAGRRVSGASTLAMQLARLNAGPGPRGWWRKLEEASAALFLTARYGREAVMRSHRETRLGWLLGDVALNRE